MPCLRSRSLIGHALTSPIASTDAGKEQADLARDVCLDIYSSELTMLLMDMCWCRVQGSVWDNCIQYTGAWLTERWRGVHADLGILVQQVAAGKRLQQTRISSAGSSKLLCTVELFSAAVHVSV
jgi:hypothetical protein